MRRRVLPTALLSHRMRCIRELARTEGQVHTGTADTRGVAAVRGRDFAVGKVFWAEAACPIAASQPAGPDGRLACGNWAGGFGPKNFAHSKITPTDSSDATSIRSSGVNLSFCPGKLTNAPHSVRKQSGRQDSPTHLL